LKLPTLILTVASVSGLAQTSANVLLIVNENSAVSKSIGEYYVHRRAVPLKNVCRIRTLENEQVSRELFEREIAAPIAGCLQGRGLVESTLYIVTTLGVPLKILGSGGPDGDQAAVDSELTLLYQTIKGWKAILNGGVPNPMYQRRELPFRHPGVPMYMVTRLAGYDFADVKKMIDRSLVAADRGIVVLDLKSSSDETGNDWLRTAAIRLPEGRVLLEESQKVVYGAKNVIGYASWGSNDHNRDKRWLGFEWLPGAIATEYVSTNGRTFKMPPESWTFGNWEPKNRPKFWDESPQSLTADLIHEGATGASGHVYEPYLGRTPRPDFLFPAYLGGRNLAESYYIAMPALSWMNIVVGDPLCRLAKNPPESRKGR
jgi:uncharacterized protein (TIGR03790 family)